MIVETETQSYLIISIDLYLKVRDFKSSRRRRTKRISFFEGRRKVCGQGVNTRKLGYKRIKKVLKKGKRIRGKECLFPSGEVIFTKRLG